MACFRDRIAAESDFVIAGAFYCEWSGEARRNGCFAPCAREENTKNLRLAFLPPLLYAAAALQ
jgi:hypothetical protein